MKKLSFKILLPTISILFIGLSLLLGLSHKTTKGILNQEMINNTEFSLQSLISQSLESKSQIELLERTMSDKYINIAQAISLNGAFSGNLLTSEEYKIIAQECGIDEIHIVDKDSNIIAGSVPEFLGFNLNDSKQTAAFIPLISDKNSVLAQKPGPRGMDGLIYQYVGVSRLYEDGVILVGIKALVLQEVLNRVNMQKVIDNFEIDANGGFAFITDINGVITKHKKRSMIGNKITEYSWGNKILESDEGQFYYNLDGKNRYLSFKKIGNEILITTVYVDPYILPLTKMDRDLLIIGVVIALLLTVIITLLMTNIASKPLNILNKKILTLAKGEGDLTQEVFINKKDEVGELASGVNDFVISMRYIVSNVKAVCGETLDINDRLSKGSIESVNAVEQITSKVLEITEKINNLDEYIYKSIDTEKNLIGNIEKLSLNITNQSSAIEESTASVNQMVGSLKSVSDIIYQKQQTTSHLVNTTNAGGQKVLEVNKLVVGIDKSVTNIADMITIIDDIASQTSLLSMNAAIEAAHAGEHGKGFAVVADEIRKLSESTENNAKSINNILKQIRNQVKHATEASNETNSVFNEINSEVHSVALALTDINDVTIELSAGGQQIMDAMFLLQDVSIQVNEETTEMNKDSQTLNQALEHVKIISEEVLNMVEDITIDSVSIDSCSKVIGSLTEQLSENTCGLNRELNRFKTDME